MSTICPSCGTKNLEGDDECTHCGADLRTVDLPKPVSQIEQTVMHQPLPAVEMTMVHAMPPDTPLEVAVQTLVRQSLDIVGIVENERLVGVLSVRDIVTRVGPRYKEKLGQPVRQFMTPNPETLTADAPLTFALNKMDVGGYRHVPVVQGGRPIGVISARKVIGYLLRNSRRGVATLGTTTSHGLEGMQESNA